MLIKGEQGRYLRGQLSEAPEVDANFLSWHTGILTFRETPLSEVARSLSRYYKRPVLLGSAALASCEFSSRFDQQPLEAVLSEMQLVLPITIQTKGDTLLLNGPGCQ
jgi:ferric-dicitrate binding protein FerR (iron transport regulator)